MQNALTEFAGDDMVLQPGGHRGPLPSPAYERSRQALTTIWRDIRFDRQPRISFETAIWLMRTVAYTIAPRFE
jgi:hypothetical protein